MRNLRRLACACPAQVMWKLAENLAAACFLSLFFYRSAWGLTVFLPLAGCRFYKACRALERRITGELNKQFQECIMSVAAGMKAGYSVENAFCESMGDMRAMFGNRSRIVRELEELVRGMHSNIPLERQLAALGRRNNSTYITEFAEVLAIAHKSGGNPAEVIADTADAMNAMLKTAAEIDVLLSGRKLEGRIMKGMPFLLALYVRLGNPAYFDILYHNPAGIAVMTLLLAMYLTSAYLTERIVNIRVGRGM